MVNRLRRNLLLGVPAALALRPFAAAAQAPLRIEITEGVIEPMPFAAPAFVPDTPAAGDLASRITQVVIDDLVGTGLFREIPRGAHIGRVTNFDAPVQFADWKAINAQALVTGAAAARRRPACRCASGSGTSSPRPASARGCSSRAAAANWRRMGHKVADAVYSRLTGEGGYFDSRVAYVAASGPKSARRQAARGHGLRRGERGDADRRPRAGADPAHLALGAADPLHELRAGRAAGAADGGRRRAAHGARRRGQA